MLGDGASRAKPVHAPTLGALPDVRTFCEAVLYECLALEKAEVLPAYLRLYHLTASLTQLAHSLPVHSVRMLSAYYASPTLASMRAGLLPPGLSHDGYTPSEPLLQPTFIHSLTSQLDALFSSLSFDAQLGRHGPSGPATRLGAGAHAAGVTHNGTTISEGQRRILYGAFLALHGILPANHIIPAGHTSAAGAELLPFILATLVARGGDANATAGDTRGLHAAALRIAALGASDSPWAQR